MPIEMVLTLECFVANVAKVLPLIAVCESVLGKSRGVSKHFIAQVTLLGTSLGFVPVV